MSRSVLDLKEVCLELCAGGILIKAMELVKLPNYQSLDPVEFLYECLVSEAARRQTRKVATQIKKSACFYPDACIENTLYAPDRNLNRGLIERLAGCDWIRNGEHCVITGATGSGKTWLASALMLHDSIKYPPIDNRNDPPRLSKEVLSHAKKKEDHGLRCVQQWRIKNHDQTRRKSEDPAPGTR